MALLLLLALLAPILTKAEERRAALFFLSASVLLLVAPILTSEYDYRFTIPAFGPLAATAAIGAWAAAVRVRPLLVRARRPLSVSDRGVYVKKLPSVSS